jgi:hypothetical protein
MCPALVLVVVVQRKVPVDIKDVKQESVPESDKGFQTIETEREKTLYVFRK